MLDQNGSKSIREKWHRLYNFILLIGVENVDKLWIKSYVYDNFTIHEYVWVNQNFFRRKGLTNAILLLSKIKQGISRSSSSTGKMPKLLGRMPWPGFEPRYLHLCVWVYNGFAISSIYQKKKEKWHVYILKSWSQIFIIEIMIVWSKIIILNFWN